MHTAMHELVQVACEVGFHGCPLIHMHNAAPLAVGEYPCIGCPYNLQFLTGSDTNYICILTIPYRRSIREHFRLVNT